MGREKAWLKLGGRPLIQILVELLTDLFERVRIVGTEGDRFAPLDVSVVADLRPGTGPLGGIHTALATAEHSSVFVTACDYPFLSPPFIQHLAARMEDYDAVVPRIAEGPVPVCAFYSPRCLPAVEACLNRGDYKAASFLRAVHVRWIEAAELEVLDPHGLALTNLNTPEDYSRARGLVESGGYDLGRRGG